MNDVLLLAGLAAVGLGATGLIRPNPLLLKSRWLGLCVFGAGGFCVLAGMIRSDAGAEPGASHMLLDDYMPTYDVHEIHAIRIHAPPDKIYAAIQAVRISDLGVANGLIFLRSLPSLLRGNAPPSSRSLSRPLFRLGPNSGFFLLAEEPAREMVIGFVGKFWKPAGSEWYRCTGPEEFLDFDQPDYAKAAWNLHIDVREQGWCRLSTETRVLGTDPESRRKFQAYWSVIYPGAAYIRRVLLKAIKRRAERS
jgi:hypothetical protein